MKPTAQYLKYLMQLKVPIKVPGRQVGPEGGFNIHDFDLEHVPPPELNAADIALKKLFGPPIKFAGKRQDAC